MRCGVPSGSRGGWHPGKDKAENIPPKVVSGIRDQGEGVRSNSKSNLDDYVGNVQQDATGKHTAEVWRCVRMGMGVRMRVVAHGVG